MKKATIILGIMGFALIAGGGIFFAIQNEMTIAAAALLWVGLLLILFFLYTNFTGLRNLLAKRSTKYGANMLLMIAIFGGVVVLLAFFSTKNSWHWDLTKAGRYTLSEQTIKILKGLTSEVHAIAFYRSEVQTLHAQQRQAAEDLLQEYSHHSPFFKYEFVDPDRNPGLAIKYGVSEYRIILLLHEGKEVKIGRETEDKITNSLLNITRGAVKTVYFLKGHGENDTANAQKNGYRAAKAAIEKESYKVKDLLLIAEQNVPDDAALLIVSSPKRGLMDEEMKRIAAYLRNGGRVLFMLDPGFPLSIKPFIESYGFKVGDNVIVDKQSQVYGMNYLTPLVFMYDKMHPLTKDFNIASYFTVACSVEVEVDTKVGKYNLASTGPNSWTETDLKKLEEGEAEYNEETEKRGPIPVMAVSIIEVAGSEKPQEGKITRETYGKIIVAGDSDFANNEHLNLGGNGDLFLNTVNWLAEEADLISIRKKEAQNSGVVLTVKQGRVIFWIPVVVIPSFVLFLMAAHYVRRRMGQ
jgi:ABC-type uncharacterized transport system involved in gliding motility auxiliary subunit